MDEQPGFEDLPSVRPFKKLDSEEEIDNEAESEEEAEEELTVAAMGYNPEQISDVIARVTNDISGSGVRVRSTNYVHNAALKLYVVDMHKCECPRQIFRLC